MNTLWSSSASRLLQLSSAVFPFPVLDGPDPERVRADGAHLNLVEAQMALFAEPAVDDMDDGRLLRAHRFQPAFRRFRRLRERA